MEPNLRNSVGVKKSGAAANSEDILQLKFIVDSLYFRTVLFATYLARVELRGVLTGQQQF